MPRSIWRGAISFGLVTIPVELYSATKDHTVHFNQFQRGTSDRIRYKRVNERTGEEVEFADIVKGHEVGDGEFVLLEQEELDEIAPGRSQGIEIDAFVDLDEIDPIHFQKTYWLAPARPEYARPYGLLRDAMDRANRVGVAKFVMRGKQYLTALRAEGDLIALETMYFADEIRDPKKVVGKLPPRTTKTKEVAMATSLVESMSGPWKPKDYRDTYTAKVTKLVADKQAGKEIVAEAEPPRATGADDLMDVLSRSVENIRGKRKATDLADLSKADLDRRARQLKISGRSKMKRGELEKAVRKAS
jgi:DNA end-binding protein Ku